MAGASLALLMGTKSMALAWVPLLAVYCLATLIWHHGRKRPLALVSVTLGGVALICAMASVTYLRNWLNFHNPIWPIAYENPKFHISFPGVVTLSDTGVNRSLSSMYHDWIQPPVPGKDYADTRVFGYGFAAPIILLPLAFLAGLGLIVRNILSIWRKFGGSAHARDDRDRSLLGFALVIVATGYVSPNLWSSRYNVQLIALVMIMVAWATRTLSDSLSTSFAGFAVLANIVSLSWLVPPLGGVDLATTYSTSLLSPSKRVSVIPAGWSIPPAIATARERELGPKTVTVFTDSCDFPSTLWNERFSNTLVYIPPLDKDAALARVREVGAIWAVAHGSEPLYQGLKSDPQWEELGLISRGGSKASVFRRKR